MKITILILTTILPLITSKSFKESCPEKCHCKSFHSSDSSENNFKLPKPSSMVQCLSGNLDEHAFYKIMSTMPSDVSVLKIIGPKDKPNRFSITQDFERFKELTELHLDNCGITSLAKRTFENLKNLRLLNVANNQLDQITPESFENTEHILSLNFSGNQLNKKTFSSGAFAYLPNLLSLDLSYNKIENFSTANILAGLNKLQHLSLDGNVLKSKNFDMLFDVPKLESLSINDCRLTEIPASAFSKNPLLKSLSAKKNRIKSTYISAVKNVPLLDTLDLSDNWITGLEDNTFIYSPNLKKLTLHGNYIGSTTVISNEQQNPYQLQYTRSAGNKDKIDLQELDLSNNGIVAFKSSYMKSILVGSIKTLKLSANNLTVILDEQTKNMNNLRNLYLADINLVSLPDNLPLEFMNLEHLDVSNNSLSALTLNQTQTLQNLVSLDISYNNFTTLSDSERRFMLKLKRAYLHNNPWDCQHCRTLRNLNMVLKNDSLVESEVLCGSPPEYYGKSVITVYKSTECSKMYGAMADKYGESEYGLLIAGISALTFIVVMTTAIICCYAWKKQTVFGTGHGGNSNGNTLGSSKSHQNTEETMTLSSADSSDHDRCILEDGKK